MSLSEFIDRASAVTGQQLLALTQDVKSILAHERSSGRQGNWRIEAGLVYASASGELIVAGDIHGDLESLTWILKNSRAVEKIKENAGKILFLGDYGDRGFKSPEVYSLVLLLKATFPQSVTLLRGNHEGPEDLQAVPHDLPCQLHKRFGEEGHLIYNEMRMLFGALHHAAILDGKYLLLHGGVPSFAKSLDEIARANLTHPATTHLEEILWSDPAEGMTGTAPSPRGAGKLFGHDVTAHALRIANVKTLIRGHEPCYNGVSVSHDGMVLTVFSRKGPPYDNEHAAYLCIDATEPARTAHELSESACLF